MSSTEPDHPIIDIPPTHCYQIDNFMKFEPCWQDYGPKREVDKARDIYRYTENGGGKINSETLSINGTTFANPMLEILEDYEPTKFFMWRNLTIGMGPKKKDIYIMPIEDSDVDDLNDLKEFSEFEEPDDVDLTVPGFFRTVVHCDDLEACDKVGILEITEMFTDWDES